MALYDTPVIKKFFSNKIESSRDDWYGYIIKIARIFLECDGDIYNRDTLLNKFVSLSNRDSSAERDVANFRDEFGAYGSFLGLYHLEKDEERWVIRVSDAAKHFLCSTHPNAEAFCRVQLALFQYPNGMGAVISDNGSVSVQGNVKNDTLREVKNGIRLNPFRLICRLVVALHENRIRISCITLSDKVSILYLFISKGHTLW